MTAESSDWFDNIVRTSQIRINESPNILKALGISSCIVIALYDPQLKLGGLAHAMLPYKSVASKRSHPPGKFVDSAIELMIDMLVKKGAKPKRLQSKLVGGANLVKLDRAVFGRENIQSAQKTLKKAKIPIVAKDVGKNYGRTVHFDLSTGKVRVRKVGEKYWKEL